MSNFWLILVLTCLINALFCSFDEPFEEVVYPKGDSDAVTISKQDVDLLQPDTFVNDTIIDFYIKYVSVTELFFYRVVEKQSFL